MQLKLLLLAAATLLLPGSVAYYRFLFAATALVPVQIPSAKFKNIL